MRGSREDTSLYTSGADRTGRPQDGVDRYASPPCVHPPKVPSPYALRQCVRVQTRATIDTRQRSSVSYSTVADLCSTPVTDTEADSPLGLPSQAHLWRAPKCRGSASAARPATVAALACKPEARGAPLGEFPVRTGLPAGRGAVCVGYFAVSRAGPGGGGIFSGWCL